MTTFTTEQTKEKTIELINSIPELYTVERSSIIDILNTPTDITSNVYSLIEYTKNAKSVVELGVRAGNSTRIMLFSKPKVLRSYDISNWSTLEVVKNQIQNPPKFYKEQYRSVTDFEFSIGDSTKITIPECEVLFIDTLHHRQQLEIELEKHHRSVSKYIILHDTFIYGNTCENAALVDPKFDKNNSGLLYALTPFIDRTDWIIKEQHNYSSGLTILEREQ